MIAETNLTSNDAIIFNRDAAADASLGRNDDALADVTVMTDVNHVVELCALAYSCPPQGSAIHGSVGPQLNVIFDDHCPDLRKLVITHVITNIPESVRADNYSGVQDDSIANRDAVLQKNVRMNNAGIADGHVIAGFRAGRELRPISITELSPTQTKAPMKKSLPTCALAAMTDDE